MSLTGPFLSGYGLPWHPHFPVSRWAQSGSHSLLMGINKLQKHQKAIKLPPQIVCAKTFDASHTNALSVAGLLSFLYLIIIFTEPLKPSLSVVTVFLSGCLVFLYLYLLRDWSIFYDVNIKWLASVFSFYKLDFNGPYTVERIGKIRHKIAFCF